MSRLSNWASELWKQIRWDMVFKAAQKLLISIIGTVGKSLAQVAIEEVKKAEATGASGTEKLRMVYEALRRHPQFRNLPAYALNIAIESAVSLVDPKTIG